MQARGRSYTTMVQKASSSPKETSTLLQNSVLKKSQTRSTMTKFSKKSPVDFFRCSHGFHGQMPSHIVPAKKWGKFHYLSQNFKEKWKSGCFKVNEKTQTLESGFSKKKKSNPSLPSLYILVFSQVKVIALLQDLERHYKGERAKSWEFE